MPFVSPGCGRSPTSILISSARDAIARFGVVNALERCEPECWDRLVASLPMPSPFMRWAWHQAWAESASPEDLRASFVLMLPDAGESVRGILPLAVRSVRFRRARARALTWAAAGVGCPDHLDFPVTDVDELQALVPVLETLHGDVAILPGVAQEATNVAQLIRAFVERGYRTRRTVLDSCPYLDLPRSWDEYLASLSPTRRQTIRRKERKLLRDHAMVVTDYAPDRLDEGWRHLCSLHEERWAQSGALGDEQLGRLLRRFSSSLAAQNELWLTTLDLNGAPAAAWYGFACFDTVYFYQGGRDPQWDSLSVGSVLMGAMIRRAIERGYRRFDFLRGQDDYKLSWTSTARLIYEVVLFRPDWRGTWLNALDLMGRARARIRSRPEFATSEGPAGLPMRYWALAGPIA